MALAFDARNGLSVNNGAVQVVDANGKIVSSFSNTTIGSIPYQSASGVTSFLADVATGSVLISGGVGVAPSYGKVDLTAHTTGTLPVANGGTGTTTTTGTGANVLSTSPAFTTGISITGGTVTVNSPVISSSQTWNDSAIAFAGISLAVTDTASSATSSLIDLSVGGVSKFSI